MNNPRINSLFSSLDNAVEILAETRTSDAICTAAFDTLKQARAMIARAFTVTQSAEGATGFGDETAAIG